MTRGGGRIEELERALVACESELEAALSRRERLFGVTAELARAMTPAEVGVIVVNHAVTALQAVAGMVGMCGENSDDVEVLAAVGYPRDVVASFQRLPRVARAPLTDAIRCGEPVLLGSLAERAARYPQLTMTAESISGGGLVALPLTLDGRVLGGLGFHFAGERAFTDDDRSLFRTLAQQCAQAMERAQLYQEARAARARAEASHAEAELLYHLTSAVSAAETLDQVHERSLEGVLRALGTDRGSILLCDQDGVMRFKAWRGLSDEYRRAVEGHSPWAPDDPAPVPILVADVRQDPALGPFLPTLEAEGILALAFFPLVHGRKLLGKFMVYFPAPHAFTTHEVRLATTIGSQIAQAVARKHAESDIARLFHEAEAARRAAEQAANAREELMAIVSHDLRTPLSTITLGVGALKKLARELSSDRLERQADRFQRAASNMERLISDLLDFSAIQSGSLKVNTERLEVIALLEQAVELLSPQAAERQQTIALGPANGHVQGEADRVLQVLSNLIGNAIKFTPVGGSIEIGAAPGSTEVTFWVKDSGPGITPEDLPRVFDRFWQARRSERKGVGLGLAIAKGLVVAHRGEIWAESRPGEGATFRFTLPAA